MAVSVEIVDHDRLEERKTEKQEFACGTCGYGIVVTSEPPVCPMCRSSVWGSARRELERLRVLP
jgi:rubrerythrin